MNRLFGVVTPLALLHLVTLVDCAPANPQPMRLLSVKMPSAGLLFEYTESKLEPIKRGCR